MNLREKIDAELAAYSVRVIGNKHFRNDEVKKLAINAAYDAANKLYELAKTIRENHKLALNWDNGNAPHNILDSMVAWGQPIARFLWMADLREKITDPIEMEFGVDFGALGIYREVTNKNNQNKAYIAFDARRFNGCDRLTLFEGGKHVFINKEEFEKNYQE